MLHMRLVRAIGLLFAIPAMFPLGGCAPKYSGTVTVSCNADTGVCTIGGGITISSQAKVLSLGTADLLAATNAGYTVTFAVPNSELLPASSSPVQTTLTGTTDTGYAASITKTLTPLGSVADSTYNGYTDYSYAIPADGDLATWANSLGLNTTDSVSLVTTTNGVFAPAGVAGTYSVYVTITSAQIGTLPGGSAVFTDPGVPAKKLPSVYPVLPAN